MTDTTDHHTVADIHNTDRDITENCEIMDHGKGRHLFYDKLIVNKANNYFNFANEGPRSSACVVYTYPPIYRDNIVHYRTIVCEAGVSESAFILI